MTHALSEEGKPGESIAEQTARAMGWTPYRLDGATEEWRDAVGNDYGYRTIPGTEPDEEDWNPLHDANQAKLCTDEMEKMRYGWELTHWDKNIYSVKFWRWGSTLHLQSKADTENEAKCLAYLRVKDRG